MFIDTDNEIPINNAHIRLNQNVSRDLRSKKSGKKVSKKWYTQILKMTEIAIK